MFQSPPPQQQPQNQQLPPSTGSNDGIFWSPAPTHPVQPTSILQRPQQQPLPQQSTPMNTPGTTSMAPALLVEEQNLQPEIILKFSNGLVNFLKVQRGEKRRCWN